MPPKAKPKAALRTKPNASLKNKAEPASSAQSKRAHNFVHLELYSKKWYAALYEKMIQKCV